MYDLGTRLKSQKYTRPVMTVRLRPLSMSGKAVYSDIAILRENLRQSLKECAYFNAAHGVEVDNIFSDRWSLDDADRAYKEFDKQTGGKQVFVF